MRDLLSSFFDTAIRLGIILGYPYLVVTNFGGSAPLLSLIGGFSILLSWHLIQELKMKDQLIERLHKDKLATRSKDTS